MSNAVGRSRAAGDQYRMFMHAIMAPSDALATALAVAALAAAGCDRNPADAPR